MSRSATVSFDWAGETRQFRLAIGGLRDLQESGNAGPPVILGRLMSETWMVDDIRETIRLGLIGGGMTPDAALALVRRYVEDRPLKENVIPARAILTAALYGVRDEPVGKTLAGEAQPEAGPGLFRFAGFYGTGIVMGLSPREVDDLSLWQFAACVDGWMQAHGAGGPEPLAPDDVKALSDWIDQPPIWMH